MDFHDMSRRELQALCKKHHIKANTTSLQMAENLAALFETHAKPKSLVPSCLKGSTGSGDGDVGEILEGLDIRIRAKKNVTFQLQEDRFETEENFKIQKSQLEKGSAETRSSRGRPVVGIQTEEFNRTTKNENASKCEGLVPELLVRTTRRSSALRSAEEVKTVLPPVVKKRRKIKGVNHIYQDEELPQVVLDGKEELNTSAGKGNSIREETLPARRSLRQKKPNVRIENVSRRMQKRMNAVNEEDNPAVRQFDQASVAVKPLNDEVVGCNGQSKQSQFTVLNREVAVAEGKRVDDVQENRHQHDPCNELQRRLKRNQVKCVNSAHEGNKLENEKGIDDNSSEFFSKEALFRVAQPLKRSRPSASKDNVVEHVVDLPASAKMAHGNETNASKCNPRETSENGVVSKVVLTQSLSPISADDRAEKGMELRSESNIQEKNESQVQQFVCPVNQAVCLCPVDSPQIHETDILSKELLEGGLEVKCTEDKASYCEIMETISERNVGSKSVNHDKVASEAVSGGPFYECSKEFLLVRDLGINAGSVVECKEHEEQIKSCEDRFQISDATSRTPGLGRIMTASKRTGHSNAYKYGVTDNTAYKALKSISFEKRSETMSQADPGEPFENEVFVEVVHTQLFLPILGDDRDEVGFSVTPSIGQLEYPIHETVISESVGGPISSVQLSVEECEVADFKGHVFEVCEDGVCKENQIGTGTPEACFPKSSVNLSDMAECGPTIEAPSQKIGMEMRSKSNIQGENKSQVQQSLHPANQAISLCPPDNYQIHEMDILSKEMLEGGLEMKCIESKANHKEIMKPIFGRNWGCTSVVQEKVISETVSGGTSSEGSKELLMDRDVGITAGSVVDCEDHERFKVCEDVFQIADTTSPLPATCLVKIMTASKSSDQHKHGVEIMTASKSSDQHKREVESTSQTFVETISVENLLSVGAESSSQINLREPSENGVSSESVNFQKKPELQFLDSLNKRIAMITSKLQELSQLVSVETSDCTEVLNINHERVLKIRVEDMELENLQSGSGSAGNPVKELLGENGNANLLLDTFDREVEVKCKDATLPEETDDGNMTLTLPETPNSQGGDQGEDLLCEIYEDDINVQAMAQYAPEEHESKETALENVPLFSCISEVTEKEGLEEKECTHSEKVELVDDSTNKYESVIPIKSEVEEDIEVNTVVVKVNYGVNEDLEVVINEETPTGKHKIGLFEELEVESEITGEWNRLELDQENYEVASHMKVVPSKVSLNKETTTTEEESKPDPGTQKNNVWESGIQQMSTVLLDARMSTDSHGNGNIPSTPAKLLEACNHASQLSGMKENMLFSKESSTNYKAGKSATGNSRRRALENLSNSSHR